MNCGIEMNVPVGDERWYVRTYIAGTGNSIGIIVNTYFEGFIVKYQYGWIYWPSNKKSVIYAEDVFIILDMFREAFPDLDIFRKYYEWCPRVDVNSSYDHGYLIPKNRK